MRLFLLPLGACEVDKGLVITPGRDAGTRISTPIWAALVETSLGPVLIDTGMHLVHRADPDATFRGTGYAGLIAPRLGPGDHIVERLAEIGYSPGAITHVVNTHLHFDHCGGNEAFPNATLIVQRAEVEALTRTPEAYHVRDHGLPARPYTLVDGPLTLCPELELIPSPGHTYGHQSVLVRGGPRPVLLAADAIAHREVAEGAEGAWVDPEAGRRSVALLLELARREGADLLISHDDELWRRWPHSPEAYQ